MRGSRRRHNGKISSRGKNENGYEMYKNEKWTCKACKTTVFYC